MRWRDGGVVQPGGKWGLPWGLLCETSSRRELCIVPCHSCHIYVIWTSQRKNVWGTFKVINWDGNVSHKHGLFYREGGFSLCNTAVLPNVIVILTGYCKRLYRIPIFTILLLFYLFCIYWDWWCKKCNLKCPNVYEINNELLFVL